MKLASFVTSFLVLAASALVLRDPAALDNQLQQKTEKEINKLDGTGFSSLTTTQIGPRESTPKVLCKAGAKNPGLTWAYTEARDYIAGWGDAVFVADAGPGTCKRITCSWDSAVWLCNDRTSQLQVPAKEIAPFVQKVMDECSWSALKPWTQGQVFSDGDWNIILGQANC